MEDQNKTEQDSLQNNQNEKLSFDLMIDQNILFRKISLKLNKKTSANQGVFEFDESPENLLEEEDNQPIQKNREFNSSPMIKLDDQLQQNQSQTFTREFLEDQNLELTSSEKILQVLQVLIIDNVEVKDQKLMLQELYDYVSNLDTQTISNTSSKKQSPMKIQNQAAVNQRGIPDEDYEEIIFSLNDKVRHFEQVNELLKNYTNQSDKEKKELLRQNEKLRTEHDQILQRIREAENQCSQLKDDKNKLEAKNNEQTVKLLDLECEISIFKTLADDQYYHDQRFEMDVNKHQSFKEKNDNSQRVINSDGLLKLKHSSQSQDEPSIKPNQIKISPDKNSISSNGLISRHLTSPLSQIGSLSPEKQERDRIISKQIEALMEQFKKNAIEHSQITKLVELKDQEHRLELKKMHSSQQIEKKDQQVHVYKTKIDDLKLQLKQLQETNQNLQFRINALKDENKLLTLKQETEYICRQSLYRASNMSYQSNVNNSVNQGNLKLSLLKLNQKQNSGIFNQVSTPKRSLISMFGDNFMFPQNSRKVSMNSNYNQQKQSMFGNGGFRSSSLAFQGLQQSYDSNFKEYKHNPFEYLKEENYGGGSFLPPTLNFMFFEIILIETINLNFNYHNHELYNIYYYIIFKVHNYSLSNYILLTRLKQVIFIIVGIHSIWENQLKLKLINYQLPSVMFLENVSNPLQYYTFWIAHQNQDGGCYCYNEFISSPKREKTIILFWELAQNQNISLPWMIQEYCQQQSTAKIAGSTVESIYF